jgi:starch-binding outer membrane protein, SusD/RagB family
MTTLLTRSNRWVGLRALLLAPAVAVGIACTDLTETPRDALTPDNAFRTEDEILAGVASVYANLRGMMWGYYNLSEITTDELIVPTRGNDWYDNGRWLEIHRQTWSANSGSALDDMNGTWTTLFGGVARANLMIDVIETAGGAQAATTLAELRTLRAWYYFMLMDLFGNVPLVTGTEVEAVANVSRDSVFRFIEAELNAARTVLPERWPAEQYGRVTRGAANAILASMYLNAQVFTGTVAASGLTPGAQRWQAAIDAADRVLNSGVYSLNPDWRNNFSTTNETSPENIFVVAHTAALPGLGMSLPMRGLHYNMLSPEPWNGFATLAETYRTFSPADKRREVFLVGQQVSYNTGQPVKDRQGNPLIFTDTIGNAEAARENEGARLMKFPPLPGAPNGDSHPNDFPFFRLAEMYLIKAEAQNELGQTAAAIANINLVRARHFTPPQPLSTTLNQAQVRTAILNERLFELAGEAKRRQDLIRHGKFTEARRFKVAQQPFKILMPIPATQIQTNPLLTQNPGY